MMIARRTLTVTALLAAGSMTPVFGSGIGDVAVKGTELVVAAAAESASGVAVAAERDPEPHTAQGDDLLQRANSRFDSGREHYFQGDYAAAHRDFDAAVDTLLSAPDAMPDHRRVERRLEEICDLVYRFDVERLGSGESADQQSVVFDKAPIDEISHMTFPVDESLASRLKSELNQTSSAIPLELTDPVLGFVHYFSSERGRKVLLAGYRRSGRYKAMIQRIFAEEGVPQELIYLAQAESGFLPRALSYKLCAGMWQFKAETGVSYQLTRTSEYDERLDPEKATRAAARYLRDLYARYGDWYLAMAAYNCGAGAVDRAVERTGYSDYWQLLRLHALPKETSNYVPIIVAMTIMAKNPQDYQLEQVDLDAAVDYDTFPVSARTNLNLVADAAQQPVSVIRELNPALVKSIVPAGFPIHVPKGSGETALAAIETVPASDRQAWRLHHVLAGDTLDSIARTYHLPADRIVSVNRGADSLEAGDVLLIPALYREEISPLRGSARGRRARLVGRGIAGRRPVTHVAASHRVPSQVLHRKAVVRTASR